MCLHRPTDNPAAECIEHDSKIQEPSGSWDVCDVSDPELVRAIGREVAVDQVRGRTGIAITLCGDDAMAAADADDARCPHQPGDPLLPDWARKESLSRKALWVLASTPGVTCVLNGMRTVSYAKDSTAILGWERLDEAGRVYRAVAELTDV